LSSHTNATTHPKPVPAIAHDQRREPVSPWSSGTAANTGELAQRHGRAARPSEIARHLGVDVEVVLEGLAAHGAAHTWSLDEPAGHDDGSAGSGDRARFAAALGRTEPEFDLVEHREGLAPLLAMLPERERRILLLRFFGGLTQTADYLHAVLWRCSCR
jgi:DNA-directed RNA polymerase specialized sigma subunit